MFEKIKEKIQEILDNKDVEYKSDEITEKSNLRDLGLVSIDMATLTVVLEDEFGVDIFEDGIVFTIEEILEVIKQNQ